MNFQSSWIALWGIALWRTISAQLNMWFRSFIRMLKSTQRLQESGGVFFLILAYQQKTLSFTPSLKNLDQIWRGKMPTHGSAVLHFYKMPRLLVTRPSSAQKPWPKKGKIKNRTDHGKKLILSVECSHIFYQIFPLHHLKLLKFKHRAVGRGIKCWDVIFLSEGFLLFISPKIRRS